MQLINFKALALLLSGLLIISLVTACGGEKSEPPIKNLTLFVHGFDKSGYKAAGVYGADFQDPAIEKFQLLGDGYTSNNILNIIKSTTYYGDTAPTYYTESDKQTLQAVTDQWGGGIPRYALIIAKYAKHLMRQEKVDSINIVSGSMGSLVTRWLIEKDIEGLASTKKIAKWYSLEGVIRGNYAADRKEYIEKFYGGDGLDSIDITHMSTDWISDNLHNPVSDANSPYYKHIRIGMQASTDDGLSNGLLTKLLFINGQFSANDGTQRVKDCHFNKMAEEAQFNSLPPTFTLIHENHLSLKDHMGAWANVMSFLNAKKRVTIHLVDAKVEDIQENIRWYNTQAEIIFESKVFSPQTEKMWGITQAIAENTRSGAALPVHHYSENEEEKSIDQLVLDQFVPDEETILNIHFSAHEIDNVPKYGVYESVGDGYDFIGDAKITVPLKQGKYAFSGDNWSFHLAVEVHEYPDN